MTSPAQPHQAQAGDPGVVLSPQRLNDFDLAAWLEQAYQDKRSVGYLQAQFACKVFDLSCPTAPLHLADPDKESKAALRKLARRDLLQHLQLPLATLSSTTFADPAWILTPTTQEAAAALVDERLQALGRDVGRGAAISMRTTWRVWTDAGGCCMFSGCGANLSNIQLYNAPARIGYLAHIVASDPNGPRGTQDDSHRLSDSPENIMLMCDEHHRLIDCYEPEIYTAEVLLLMRQAHRDLVRGYLNSLAYPRAKAITLHANLANVPTYFHESDLVGAVLATGRAMLPGVEHHIRRTQRDDRRTPEFWVQYLHEHENHIRQLASSLNATGATETAELAIFPLHHTATLVLAGRIIGEARPVRVFQYHRPRSTWQWDPDANPQPSGTFNVEGLTVGTFDEVLITIELSATLDAESIPSNLAEALAAGRMARVRIVTPNPDGDCIQHPDDLRQFIQVARQAINHVHDSMRARRVHLIAISPASAVFCFGQMLQPGHHPNYTIYDRASRDTPFGEAFTISGHEVTASAGSQAINISIR